jgi:hypothetical protein
MTIDDETETLTITRSAFVDLVAAALVEATETSGSISKLHQSTARCIAADTFDRALRPQGQN